MPAVKETKLVKVHVSVFGGPGGRRVGTWSQALLVQKQKAVPVIRVDNITLKLVKPQSSPKFEGAGIVKIQDKTYTFQIDPKGDAAATREVKEFAQAVKEALEEYLSRKGVSAGGFQPVNTLGKATAARGTGGIVRKGVSLAPQPTKGSQPVTRQPIGLPARSALPSELPEDSPPNKRSSAVQSGSSYFHGSKSLSSSMFSPSASSTSASGQHMRQHRPASPTTLDPIESSPCTPPRRPSTQRPAAPLSPDQATFGPLIGSSNAEARGRLPVQPFRRPFTSGAATIGASIGAAKSSFFQPASGARASTGTTITPTPAGALEGFPNLGNTCYLNAVLQAMLALPSFTTDLLSALWVQPLLPDLQKAAAATDDNKEVAVVESDGMSTPAAKPLPRVYASLLRVILLSQRKDHGIIDPSAFRKAMARYYGEYGSRNQQDAHEFLGDVINTLQEELCPLARTLAATYLQPGDDLKSEAKAASSAGLTLSVGGVNTPLPTSQPQGSLTESEASVLTQILPVSRNFHIEVLKTLTCGRCGYSRSRTEAFTDFSLDLVDHSEEKKPEGGDTKAKGAKAEGDEKAKASEMKPPMLNIPELLKGFFKPQVLELECEKCKHDKVHVTFSLDKLPNVLVIHLKRFRLDGSLNHKLTTKVQAPTCIDLSPFCGQLTQNPAKQGMLPKPVVEKDCSFLVAEQTPAPPTNPSNPSAESARASTAAEGGTSTTASTITSPPAPNKLTKVLENRERKQLDEAMRRSQDEDRWDEDISVLDPASPIVPRQKRRLTTGTGEESGSKRACHPSPTAPSSPTPTVAAPSGTGSSVDTAIMLECDEQGVFDLTKGDDEETMDPDLQDAIQRSLEDQAMRESMLICTEAADLAYPPAPAPPAAPSSMPVVPDMDMDKENVCPRPPTSSAASADASHHSAFKAGPPRAVTSASPFNLSLLSPAASSREKRAPRTEALQSSFELKCVVRHIGRHAFSGHYITDVRTRDGPSGLGAQEPKVTWKRYDDSVVSKLSSDDKVLEEDRCLENGYIYFYCLQTPSSSTSNTAAGAAALQQAQ